jgi:hypothetical protein
MNRNIVYTNCKYYIVIGYNIHLYPKFPFIYSRDMS